MATAYLQRYEQSGAESPDAVERLCELATSDEPRQAHAGTDAIFRLIVERSGDRFERRWCDFYVRFFSRVVDFCRGLPQAQSVHERLCAFGLESERQFLDRAARIRHLRTFDGSLAARIKKVLVLSRVTLGADVAITSVVLGEMKRLFPKAEIGLLGSLKAGSLFDSDPRIKPVPVEYHRGGTLLERLGDWLRLADRVAAETQGLAPEEYLIIDPDSRLSQLGLLPLTTNESSYYFFESRSYSSPGEETLGELTGRWLEEVFGAEGEPKLPQVSLAEQHLQLGRAVRRAATQRLAAVNLGVGENPAKRLADPFERDLLFTLLDAGYIVILDRGDGAEELDRTGRLIDILRQAGKTVAAVPDSPSGVAVLSPVNTWKGSLSGFAGIIGVSDLYVGYDSAGGHLAAALGVPGIDIFAGAVSPRMIQRWRPWGLRSAHTIVASGGIAPSTILSQVRERLR